MLRHFSEIGLMSSEDDGAKLLNQAAADEWCSWVKMETIKTPWWGMVVGVISAFLVILGTAFLVILGTIVWLI